MHWAEANNKSSRIYAKDTALILRPRVVNVPASWAINFYSATPRDYLIDQQEDRVVHSSKLQGIFQNRCSRTSQAVCSLVIADIKETEW